MKRIRVLGAIFYENGLKFSHLKNFTLISQTPLTFQHLDTKRVGAVAANKFASALSSAFPSLNLSEEEHAAIKKCFDDMDADFSGTLDAEELGELLDAIYLMTYDYNGAWNTFTGHLAPLHADPAYPGDAPRPAEHKAVARRRWRRRRRAPPRRREHGGGDPRGVRVPALPEVLSRLRREPFTS